MKTRDMWERLNDVTRKNYLDGYIHKLNSVFLEITYKCNLNCRMCFLHGDNGIGKDKSDDHDRTLTLEEYKLLFDQIEKFHTNVSVVITGGESFARKDCIEICKAAVEHGFPISVLTNGTLISHEDILSLKALNANVILSLDGTKIVNDKVRGKGTFEKVIFVAKQLKSLDVRFHFNFTISSLNYVNIYDFANYCSDNNFNVSFEHLWFTDELENSKNRQIVNELFGGIEDGNLEGFINNFNLLDTVELKKQIKKVLLDNRLKNVYFYPAVKMSELDSYYNDLHGYIHCGKCYYHFSNIRIDPFGNIIPCTGPSVGNIKDLSINEIINGEKYTYFRNVIKEIGVFPNCRRCCKL